MAVRKKVSLPVEGGATPQMVTFDIDGAHPDNFALLFDGWDRQGVPSVRVHSECITGDMFASLRCDCGPQLREAFNKFSHAGGVILYLRQEGRGIGLKAKIDAYDLQERLGVDTNTANIMLGHAVDERNYRDAASMLKDLGLHHIRLLTNNPDKVAQLEDHGIVVIEHIQTEVYANPHNEAYIEAKRGIGHTLEKR